MDITKYEGVSLGPKKELLLPTKENAKQVAAWLKEQVLNGKILAHKMYENLNFFNVIRDEFKDDEIKEMIVKEIGQYGKEMQVSSGSIFKQTSTSTYTFEHDPVWQKHKQDEEKHKALRIAREKFLKTVPPPNKLRNFPGVQEIDGDTGEIYTVQPAIKTSSDTFSLTVK